MPDGPPQAGHNKCQWCHSFFPHGTGAPHRTKPGVTLTSACSKACQAKRNAKTSKYCKTDKGQATKKKYTDSAKGQATVKRGKGALVERRSRCPKFNLKHRLVRAANEIWNGRWYVKANKCTILAKRTPFKRPRGLLSVLRQRASAAGIEVGKGSVAHVVIPQDWWDFGDPDDVKKCWDAQNLGIQPLDQNNRERWRLDPSRLANYPPDLFPAAFPKNVMLAAAVHDGGLDLHSGLVLERANA